MGDVFMGAETLYVRIKREPGRANVHALTVARASDIGASRTVHGLEVTVTPARERARV